MSEHKERALHCADEFLKTEYSETATSLAELGQIHALLHLAEVIESSFQSLDNRLKALEPRYAPT